MKRTTKWGSLCERIAKLQEDESIVLEPEDDPIEEARNTHDCLNGIRVCDLDRDYARGNVADAGRVLKSFVGLSRFECVRYLKVYP